MRYERVCPRYLRFDTTDGVGKIARAPSQPRQYDRRFCPPYSFNSTSKAWLKPLNESGTEASCWPEFLNVIFQFALAARSRLMVSSLMSMSAKQPAGTQRLKASASPGSLSSA